MNMEKTIIRRTIGYLISRDIWLAMLICGHGLIYYNYFPQVNIVILSVLAAGAVLWIILFIRFMRFVSNASKDEYLTSAFRDEYFSNIKMRAGYSGYVAMVICCVIFILGSIVLNELSIEADIPIFIAGEITMLAGVVTGDISKILLARG